MKKLILLMSLTSALASLSHAQGLVLFTSGPQASSTNNTLAQLGATAVGRLAPANSYYFALFYSATATTVAGSSSNSVSGYGSGQGYAFNDSNWTQVTSTLGTNTSTAGRFSANNPNADGSTTIPNLTAGNTAEFLVLGWSSNLGNSVGALVTALNTPGTSGFIGESVVSGPIATGNGGSLPTPALFGGSAPYIQGYTLGSFIIPVPEPGTMALAALSGASLLLFRRRK
jgi:hypothetical protein